jgi:hypothetical protein
VTTGDVVWALIGGSWVIWTVTTALVRRLPGLLALVRALLGSWTGRAISLAAWAGAGWHLFCQRP